MRMTDDESRRCFRDARVARMATVSAAGTPHLVPVTFAVIDAATEAGRPTVAGRNAAELIVFAVDHKPKSTTALRRLANIAANPRVAFLVDRYDDDWDRLAWVRADTVAGVIEGADRFRGIAALRAKYPQYDSRPPHGVVVGGVVSRWSGWRATASDGADEKGADEKARTRKAPMRKAPTSKAPPRRWCGWTGWGESQAQRRTATIGVPVRQLSAR